MWALRAFFGGRNELMKQGLTWDVLHSMTWRRLIPRK